MQPASGMDSATAPRPRVFDPSRKFEITIPHPDYEKGKTCVVRFPTDQEWCDRYRKQVVIRRNIGRDNVKTETRNEDEGNLELLHKIWGETGGNVDFDAAEAKLILDRIARCQVTSVEREGSNYRITMAVPGADVVHILKIPTQKQIMDHQRASFQNTSKRNVQETKTFLEPTGELWNKLAQETDGYPPSFESVEQARARVPIIHKDIALTELILQFQEGIDEGPDPND